MSQVIKSKSMNLTWHGTSSHVKVVQKMSWSRDNVNDFRSWLNHEPSSANFLSKFNFIQKAFHFKHFYCIVRKSIGWHFQTESTTCYMHLARQNESSIKLSEARKLSATLSVFTLNNVWASEQRIAQIIVSFFVISSAEKKTIGKVVAL